jgi:hypothetical protein
MPRGQCTFRESDVTKAVNGLDPSDVGANAPLRLALAAALAYPDGSMTASGLRKEAARGRLAVERTAGKDYTTLAAIEEMRMLCRLQPKVRDYGLEKQDGTVGDASPTPRRLDHPRWKASGEHRVRPR